MACLTHTQNNNEEYTCSKQVQGIQFEPGSYENIRKVVNTFLKI